jgi:VPS62-like protein
MFRNHIFIKLLLCLISTVAIADPWQDPDKEPSKEPGNSVEETERQKIITELSYRLDTKLTCKQMLTWSDKGSGADLDGFFFTPSAEYSYYIIGGYARRKGGSKSKNCVISVRQSKNNPEETPDLLVSPSDWSLIWTDKGSGANADGSMWKGVPPSKEYKCLGSVMQKGYKKPVLSNYRCVHSGLTKEIQIKSIVWTDKGSGADRDVTVFKLPNSKSFFAVGRKKNKVKTFDLNDTASIEPDAAVVEKLLSQRLEEINKIQEAEKKRVADEEAKKHLAEAAASKKIAEEKHLAEEAKEQVRLSEEAKNLRIEQEAEKKRKAEEEQEQESLAVEAEQEKQEQEPEDIQEAEESEQEAIAEVIVVQQPDLIKEINQPQAIEKAGKKDSKFGLKILFVFMLLLLIYTAYKVFGVLIDIVKGDKK